MKNSLKSLWDCIIHEEKTSCWSEREREGKVSHQTASVMLNTDAEHICQITGLKIDTFTTDRQLHTLQQRTTKQTRFKQTDDMECCTMASLRGSDAWEFTSKLQSSETTETCAKLQRNDRRQWMHPTRTGGVRFKIKERDILVFKTRKLKEAPSAPVSIQPGKKSVFYVLGLIS